MKKLGIIICVCLFLMIIFASCKTIKDCPAYSKQNQEVRFGIGVSTRN